MKEEILERRTHLRLAHFLHILHSLEVNGGTDHFVGNTLLCGALTYDIRLEELEINFLFLIKFNTLRLSPL